MSILLETMNSDRNPVDEVTLKLMQLFKTFKKSFNDLKLWCSAEANMFPPLFNFLVGFFRSGFRRYMRQVDNSNDRFLIIFSK